MFFEPNTKQGKLRIEFFNRAIDIKNSILKNQRRYLELLILYKHTNGEIKYGYALELLHKIESLLDETIFTQYPVILEIFQYWANEKMCSYNGMPDLKFNFKIKKDNMIEDVNKYINEYIQLKNS